MSRSLGPQLPDALVARLMADPADRLDQAVVLVSVDPYGLPHPALVSYGELLALDATRIRLALHAGTRSVTHLRDAGRATLVFADAELNLYVKADAVPLPTAPGHTALARFELHVRDVLEDRAEGEEAGAHVTGGITFRLPAGTEVWLARLARLRRALSH
ncbi:MAG: pyridoxamine 5'-phosphate oxidase family protein [Candidatus Rokuibacteriota bacterium]